MLSDVMKQVVQEILQRDKTIIPKQVNNGSEKSDASLSHIKRPNYQHLKKEKRLSFAAKNNLNPSKPVKRINREDSPSLPSKKNNNTSISALHSLSLAQGKGNVTKKNNTNSRQNKRQSKKSRIIGTTKNGGCVWFFPELPKDLLGSFRRPLNSAAVGVVKMQECLPSYLLLINEMIRNNQGVKFHLCWNKEAGVPFTAELYDDDVDRLEKIMNDMYQKINRRALKQYETYTAVSPGSWLSSQMNIGTPVDAIAFLEGTPYYTNIVLMETILANFKNSDFNYEINSNYLLLTGNYHVISKLVTELKKEAARLISTDRMN